MITAFFTALKFLLVALLVLSAGLVPAIMESVERNSATHVLAFLGLVVGVIALCTLLVVVVGRDGRAPRNAAF